MNQTKVSAIFARRRTVGAGDIDRLAHVNNVVWLRWVVELARAHASAVGVHFEEHLAGGHAWVVRRHEIDYHRAIGPGVEILEETWVSELRGARLVRQARFRLSSDGTLLVAARTLWAWVEVASMRPKRVPKEIADRFAVVAPVV